MRLSEFRITRFQFRRDRTIGDSQVRADSVNVAALELVADTGEVGLGFVQTLFHPLPAEGEIARVFADEAWPELSGKAPIALVHRISRPRGGNNRPFSIPFHEALQVALWDLAAKQVSMPLYRLLGGNRNKVRAYASGLDFHLDDNDFTTLFTDADALGYRAFKIKVGSRDFERDLHRLTLLAKAVRPGSRVMIDVNEAWGAKEAVGKIEAIRQAGHDVYWVEDPVPRLDFEGLRLLRQGCPWTLINSGEYLDADGKRQLLEAGGADILNVHGQITDVMRVGWLAAQRNIPITVGNTFLEIGVHLACALPEVEWLEYSFQNLAHLVEEPIEIREGWILAPERPGHGLVLREAARREWRQPEILSQADLGDAPHNPWAPKRPTRINEEEVTAHRDDGDPSLRHAI